MEMCECGKPRGSSSYKKCMECVYSLRKERLIAKADLPPGYCSIHNVQKTRNNCGADICKQCNKEKAKQRALEKITSGKLPTDCSKCNGSRVWDSFGQSICKECSGVYKKAWGDNHTDHVKEYKQNHYETNRQDYAIKNKKYRKDNKETLRESHRRYLDKMGPLLSIWRSMNARCYNPNNKSYDNYGNRNIEVHSEWKYDRSLPREERLSPYFTFRDYVDKELGPKPSPEHSIDRINNHKGYEPGNIRWATLEEQANNKRSSLKLKQSIPDTSPIYDFKGKLTTLKVFADEIKLPIAIARYRYAQNWDPNWILHSDVDNRYYEYKGHKYNIGELVVLSGLKYSTIHSRLTTGGWSVEQTIEKGLRSS